MGVRLVLVDHHTFSINLNNYENVTIIRANNLDSFYDLVSKYLEEKYDLLITDEDPDGVTSAIIYMLSKDKNIKFHGNRSGLSSTSLQDFEKKDIKNILAFDWFPISFSEIQAFEEVIVLNPIFSGLKNVNTSEIIYRAVCPPDNNLLRDLSAIGTICDYLVDTSHEKFDSFLKDYRQLFPLLYELNKKRKLDRYNILRLNKVYTKLFDISLMFWAPFIVDGQEGNEKLVKLIIKNQDFTIKDLIDGSDNKAVNYLRESYIKLIILINKEKENFFKEVKTIGNVYIYSPKTNRPGLQSKFSSMICDEIAEENPNAVIMMKSYSQEVIRYSIRTRGVVNLVDLLSLVNMGGGGHPNAAGVNIKIKDEKDFESRLIDILIT